MHPSEGVKALLKVLNGNMENTSKKNDSLNPPLQLALEASGMWGSHNADVATLPAVGGSAGSMLEMAGHLQHGRGVWHTGQTQATGMS